MAYEKGGRADKYGNRFEYNWVIYNLLQIIEEKKQYITLEPIGEDEKGVDLWVGSFDGIREGQQCKGRYGSDEAWSYGTANAKGILENWRIQLGRDDKIEVSLVSPLAFTMLEDLTTRARNSNNSVEDFYNYQINEAGVGTKRLFENYCKAMDIDYNNEEGMKKSINYLSRTHYRQISDSELKNLLLDKISMYFIGDSSETYAKFLELVLTEDIYAKKIDLAFLDGCIQNLNIEYKNLSKDIRVFPRIKELNDEYNRSFTPFKNGLIVRDEFEVCRQIIDEGNSFILHGSAGIGKSGCTENIINFCKEQDIPYLAVKLDKRIPADTTAKWGESMGLPASPAFCINAVSEESKALLIFDQLDALRWTQAHSGTALDICMQIIREVNNLNKSRAEKIIIVFVSRTYDLLNDRGIKSLFDISSDKQETKWGKIKINELSANKVNELTGETFISLNSKLKKLLAIPSNMYIWQYLESNESCEYIDTARKLVNEWWSQLETKAENCGLNSDILIEMKKQMVTFCDTMGRINVPNTVVQTPVKYKEFLQSNGFLSSINNLLSFTHESTLDIFLSEHMILAFYSGKSIVSIIGNKEKQIPGKRYQTQLFMEQMLEDSKDDFLTIGMNLLKLDEIRFSFKYIFLETLAVVNSPSKKIIKFVCQMTEDIYWGNHFIDNVVNGRYCYVEELIRCGILEKWLLTKDKLKIAIRLLSSVSIYLNANDIILVEKYIFVDDDLSNEWVRCFSRMIYEESDELFELRLRFYQKYPKYISYNIDIKDMLQKCEIRTIRVLALMLKEKIRNHGNVLYKYEEDFILEDLDILNEYYYINEMFLPLFPNPDECTSFSKWDARHLYNIGIERACVQILKKANIHLVLKNPEDFWEIYKVHMHTGHGLYNEIILDGLYHMSKKYANKIVDYLCKNLNLTIFETTSGNYDELKLGKRLIRKIAADCDEKHYLLLEKKIINYIDTDAVRILKNRIERNKEQGINVYWRYWGDFQRECLMQLPQERLSKEANHLLALFTRSRSYDKSVYEYSSVESGGVVSPVSGKHISYKAWKGIITNDKIPCNHSRYSKKIKGNFVESSQDTFAGSLEFDILKEGSPLLEYILSIDGVINDIFIKKIYSAIAYNDNMNEIDISLIEKMFKKFGYNYEDRRARSIARIIEKRINVKWSDWVITMLWDIATNHKDPELGKYNVIPQDDKEIHLVESIESNVINSTRSIALRTIGELIWNDNKMAEKFSEPIKKAINDKNPIMKYASLHALWPIYNINRDWATEQILFLYQQDIRMAGFRESKEMLFLLYEKHSEVVTKIAWKMFVSKDKRLIEIAGHFISEVYILHDEFKNIICDEFVYNKEQKESVLDMLILYVSVGKYKEKAKAALLSNVDDDFKLEFTWKRLFYDKRIDLNQDIDFINKLLSSSLRSYLFDVFLAFLEDTRQNLVLYSDVILDACRQLIEKNATDDVMIWGLQDNISKVILLLYDATSDMDGDFEMISMKCLEMWDIMYEKQIGRVRELSKKLMEL
jgi:hypothetical protein